MNCRYKEGTVKGIQHTPSPCIFIAGLISEYRARISYNGIALDSDLKRLGLSESKRMGEKVLGLKLN